MNLVLNIIENPKEYFPHNILNPKLQKYWLTFHAKVSNNKYRSYKILGLIVLLLFFADYFFWSHGPGITIALFSMLFSAAIILSRQKPATGKQWFAGMGFVIGMNLPTIEYLQPLSFMFSALAVIGITFWSCLGASSAWQNYFRTYARIIFLGHFQPFVELHQVINKIRHTSNLPQKLLSLVMPVTIGIVFLGLLAIANPYFERILDQFAYIERSSEKFVVRLLFWGFLFLVIYPYLQSHLFKSERSQSISVSKTEKPAYQGVLINAEAVRNSLLLFNAIFAIQTTLDVFVLIGGAELPSGMTYAQYAHRGSYPLVVTALLAGAFAILTRKFIIQNVLMRNLVYLWLAQTLFMVVMAAFRLNLYVETYALTYMRISAFVWMFLVFIGLALIMVQILKTKRPIWLVRWNIIATLAVLYICCFANFAPIIARYNISNTADINRLDIDYICSLGPQVLPVIMENEHLSCEHYYRYDIAKYQPIGNWRKWDFRTWRLGRYIALNKVD